ncbi:hypothetical protein [uncultured Aquimarina sp.]|uniref:hypothetical protein n=1 Tax=uncultured Aquimarina sp. TaxID=575652 RepID=UPI00260A9BC1|nr:hypothetical protein [uncultured Aquimarina sp.]
MVLIEKETYKINLTDLEYLKIQIINSDYTVAITDSDGHEILKGYGSSIEDAINDLHHNLI